jgi:hypothetical protein
VDEIILIAEMMLKAEKNKIEKNVERPAEDLAVPIYS